MLAVKVPAGGRKVSPAVPVTMVLADDRPENRTLVRAYLTVTFGAEVVVVGEAADGVAATRLCQDLQPDLLVLDDDMPHLSGTAAMAGLRRASADTFIVLYSASPIDVRALHAPDRHVDKVGGLEPLGAALMDGIDATKARRSRSRRAAAIG
jgi:CheY-like chemotaxis protein